MTREEFLQHFTGYYLKTLDDKASKEAIPKRKSLYELIVEGQPSKFTNEKLNDLNKQGAGIFFTTCDFTGAESRKSENCVGVNSWFMECDNCSKEDQMIKIKASPLPPTFIVETGKSYHCYWLSKDGIKENFREIQTRLVNHFDADPANKDLARVFRIPGYYHMKKEPFLVTIVYSHPEYSYTEKQMTDVFKLPEKKEVKPFSKTQDKIWGIMTSVSSKEMLIFLSGKQIVNGEVYTFGPRREGGELIYIDGSLPDAWLDEQGMIASGQRGGPTWIQWLMYYGKTKAEVVNWFKENFSHLLEDSKEGLESTEEILRQIDESWDTPVISWGVKEMDRDSAPIIKGAYVLLVGEMSSGKTPFTLQLAIKNADLGFNVAYFSLEVPNKTLLRNWALKKLGYTFKGAKEHKFVRDKVAEMVRKVAEKIVFVKFSENNIDYIIRRSIAGKYDLIVVDNIGYISADATQEENRSEKIISRGLNSLSRDHGVTVIAIQHFRKRGGGGRKQKDEDENPIQFRSYDDIAGTAKFNQDPWILAQTARIMNPNATPDDKEKFFVLIMKDKEHDKRGLSKLRYIDGEFINDKSIY